MGALSRCTSDGYGVDSGLAAQLQQAPDLALSTGHHERAARGGKRCTANGEGADAAAGEEIRPRQVDDDRPPGHPGGRPSASSNRDTVSRSTSPRGVTTTVPSRRVTCTSRFQFAT